MFTRLLSRVPMGRTSAARLLRQLDARLSASLLRQLRQTRSFAGDSAGTAGVSLDRAQDLLALRRRLAGLASVVDDGSKLRDTLVDLQAELLGGLGNGTRPGLSLCRREAIEAVGVLEHAIEALPTSSGVLTVPCDILVDLVRQLVPPERMAVASGTRTDVGLILSGFTDVTDERTASIAHVNAAPAKLGAALQRMDLDSAELAAWFHSHPGSGPAATVPSGTDRRQYEDWTRNYDSLVAAIVTADGHVRFWGDAVERGRWTINVTGQGAERIDARLFRLR